MYTELSNHLVLLEHNVSEICSGSVMTQKVKIMEHILLCQFY